MKDRRLAVRYARALLSATPDANDAARIDSFLGTLAEAMDASPQFRDLMLDPSVKKPERARLLGDLSRQVGLSERVVNFFGALVENNRTGSLPSIAIVFHELREERAGIVPVDITTARPLDETMRERARQAIAKMTGRTVRLACHVDAGLLGGAVTRIGSTVYDGSLRTRLDRLRKTMTQD